MPNKHLWKDRPNKQQQQQQNGEAPEPKPRGGARGKFPKIDEAGVQAIKAKNPHRPEASLRNLKQWQPGMSGNPNGKSASLNEIMRLARSHAPEAIETLLGIMRNVSAMDRDRIQAAIALLDRGCGKSVVPVFRTGSNMPDEMTFGSGAGGDLTPLLAAASQGPLGTYRRMLQDELERLDREAKESRIQSRSDIDDAREAMQRGEPVTPLMKMLVEVRDSTE